MSKKLFRRIFKDENIPDDSLLHILFEPSAIRFDITAYGFNLFATYSKFCAAYSQAKLKRVFPLYLADFIDSILVDPQKFDINTCHPFNTSNDRYYFDYESDEDYTYIWLNVYLKYFRGDTTMEEKTITTIEDTDTSLMPAPVTEVAVEPPTIESLTAEIKMYLHIANQSIIEVGKRLIQAKEMLPHGEWQSWLQNNFQLTYRSAKNFMDVATRFGKSEIDFTFKPTQLIALLALPEGDEEKFIAEKAAEGNPVENMTIKNLRAEIQKYKASLEQSDHDHNMALVKIAELQDIVHEQADQIYTLERYSQVPADYEDLKAELAELRNRPIDVATEIPADYASTKLELAKLKKRELSFKHDYTVTQTLNQFFSLIPTLLNADNLQSVVSVAADNDLQSFQLQLAQLDTLHDELKKYLADWLDDPINKRPFDRDSIINEIIQTMANDSSHQTSDHVLALISSYGYAKLHDIPDDFLTDLLKKVRNFKG